MADKIYVNQQSALSSADEFDGISKDYESIKNGVAVMESDVFGDWQGEAASAAHELFKRMDECVNQLGDEVQVHAGLIKKAVATYEETDNEIAQSY